jgi:Transposase DDE domain.
MHRRIDIALRALRQDLADRLDERAIHDACRRVGHSWRACSLTPVAVLHWFLRQVLHGNTATRHVSLWANRAFTDSAYCQARARLPLELFRALLRGLITAITPATLADGLWRGHRTLLIDGSAFSMADTAELQKHFGQPGAQQLGCGFPVAKILALFHAGTGLLIEIAAAPLRSHEMARLDTIHPALRPNDVLVGDRGFCSFAHLALLAAREVHAVFRVHQKQIVDFTPGRPHARRGHDDTRGLPRSRWIRALGTLDQIVEWLKPATPPDWMTREAFAALPALLTVRELRYAIGRPGFRTRQVTLVTTLVDAEAYPAEALADLYRSRWRVERDLRDLKQTMGMDVLKCKSVDGVLKELHVFALVYNLVRMVVAEASVRQGTTPERISFVDALRWLRDAEGGLPPRLIVHPDRPNRVEPRVRKRRPKQFPLMKQPRSALKQNLLRQSLIP